MKHKNTFVRFLIEKPEGDLPCNVFAYFPKDKWSNLPHFKDMRVSYSHIGQHSACHKDYANECKEATKEEYAPLLEELKGQGYENLQILN